MAVSCYLRATPALFQVAPLPWAADLATSEFSFLIHTIKMERLSSSLDCGFKVGTKKGLFEWALSV